jgi:hypothetical protein
MGGVMRVFDRRPPVRVHRSAKRWSDVREGERQDDQWRNDDPSHGTS